MESLSTEFPESMLAQKENLQKEFLTRHYPRLAESWGGSFRELKARLRSRLESICGTCEGRGQVNCPSCDGTGRGKCPACNGTGAATCPICRGSKRVTCDKCFGAGKVKEASLGLGLDKLCDKCEGRREIRCEDCRAGKVPCKECKGRGTVEGTCPDCKGTKMAECPLCSGTGFKRPLAFRWGPMEEKERGLVVAKDAPRYRFWQIKKQDALLTVLPAEHLYREALSLHARRLLGQNYRYLLVAVDNRQGGAVLRYSPRERSLRLVTEAAEQVEMLELPAERLERGELANKIVQLCSPGEVLPGVYRNFIALFPATVTEDKVRFVFWSRAPGSEEPWRLKELYLTEEELEELRGTMK